MPRIVITSLGEGLVQPLPEGGEVSTTGQVESRQVLGSADRPIQLWAHRLAPGAVMRWNSVSVGRGIYLWEGAMVVDGKPIAGEGAAMVEHGASCEIQAGDEGCEILEFHRLVEESQRAGGHVHALSVEQAPAGMFEPMEMVTRAYADAGCPTCDLWLHESRFAGGSKAERHYHTTDEVIVCTDGHVLFGTKTMARGSVLAVDRQALYTFQTAPTGGAFINFRGGPSAYVQVDKGGTHPPDPETPMIRAIVGTPPHLAAV